LKECSEARLMLSPKEGRDYYSLLNVPRDATLEAIKAAYKKEVMTYHPDRHLDPAVKDDAARTAALITNAYQTLSDPKKRAIYDEYGSSGLRAGWALSVRSTDPKKVRERVEQLKEEKKKEWVPVTHKTKIVLTSSLKDDISQRKLGPMTISSSIGTSISEFSYIKAHVFNSSSVSKLNLSWRTVVYRGLIIHPQLRFRPTGTYPKVKITKFLAPTLCVYKNTLNLHLHPPHTTLHISC